MIAIDTISVLDEQADRINKMMNDASIMKKQHRDYVLKLLRDPGNTTNDTEGLIKVLAKTDRIE